MFNVDPMPSRTISWWHSEKENIDMAPSYQRAGKLWSTKDRALLIDSILNGYDIPKLYVADFTFANRLPNRKRRKYAVIDGRQRLDALFDFLDDRLRLDKDFVYLGDRRLQLGGLSYSILQKRFPKIASKFANYNLSVVGVVTDDAARINEMFVRLNRGKPLTGAELRNAMSGVVPGLIRDLGKHEFFSSRVSFGSTRGQHLNVAAKLLLIEFRGRLVDTKKRPIDAFVREAEAIQNQDIKGAYSRAKDTLTRMSGIFEPSDDLLRTQGPVTVYYWLARNNPRTTSAIRSFLTDFNNARSHNRSLAAKGSTRINAELLEYDRLDRSTNDQKSMLERYIILERRFLDYTQGLAK